MADSERTDNILHDGHACKTLLDDTVHLDEQASNLSFTDTVICAYGTPAREGETEVPR